MRRTLTLPTLIGLLVAVPAVASAQASALVGSWQRLSLKDSTGATSQPPSPSAFLIISADGYYAQIAIPPGRPKVSKPVADLTRDELLARYRNTEARHGRYTVAGDTLTRTYLSSLNPNLEGPPPAVQRFRIEGDVLILTNPRPANRSEARFRRVK